VEKTSVKGAAAPASPTAAAVPPAGSLKVGLEIHQQLQTGKLFCRCPSELEEHVAGTFVRRLKATKSEMGEVDQAALAETRKGRAYRYEMTPSTSCLVDADEEPPHTMNGDALKVALTMAVTGAMNIVDEVQVMRKIVVDGSNTTGFQRTALIAGGGALPMADGSAFPLESLCLEEDSARETGGQEGEVVYRLDRLGIPLIEIATAPEIHSGEQAREVAARIGALLRATKRVKRGLGTIRQDVNISVDGGARVELKGVQDLRAIPLVVDEEARRQRRLNRAGQVLQSRGVDGSALSPRTIDLTQVLAGTSAKIVRRALDAGGRVWGIPLAGFASTLGEALSDTPGTRVLGPEFSQRARVLGLGGTIHNEEGDLAKKYGFSAGEVHALRERFPLGEHDCFLIAAGPEEALEKAFKSIVERARLAPRGVVSEVRAVNDDNTTRYLRPMPGAARMYPETDVPPIGVSAKLLGDVRRELPAKPEQRLAQLVRRTGISPALADQLAQTDNVDRFDEVAYGEQDVPGLDAQAVFVVNAAIARLLLTEVAQVERERGAIWKDLRGPLVQIRDLLHQGRFPKEAVPDVFGAMVGKGLSAEAAASAFEAPRADEARALVRKIVEANADLVRSKGEAAQGPLMGLAMKELRGKVDGKTVAAWLAEEIRRLR
jgi:glutamyl-tRNA(Gln) amidotransferase subunit E